MRHTLTQLICATSITLLTSIASIAEPKGVTDDLSNFRHWIDAARDNSRFALDLSNRIVYYADDEDWGTQNVVGLDLFKVFTRRNRDVGTLVAQTYLTRIDGLRGQPGFFKDSHDTQLVYRIVNFNYTGLPGKAPNVRVGHMEVPYGLEHTFDTNGTLRQYGAPRNLGIKADWGVSLNQQHRRFEYEAALTTGGGQSLGRNDGSFTASGRIGTNRDANTVVGLSIYRSKLANVIRERAGTDVQAYFGRYGLLAEFSAGSDDGQRVINYQVEVNTRNRRDSWQLYVQGFHFSTRRANDWNRATLATAGIRYAPDQKMSFSAQINQDLKTESGNHATTVSVQTRFRL